MRWLVVQPGPSWSVHDLYVGWTEALEQLGEQVFRFNLDDRLALYSHALVDVGEPGPNGELKLRKALTGDQAIELAVNGLAAALWKIRPHVLLIISGFFISGEMLDHARRYGTRIIIVHTEEPYEVNREVELAAHADLNLVNDPTYMQRFLDVAPSVYCPQAYRESFHTPGPPEPHLAADMAFVGTGFGSRRWFFENMNLDGLDVLLAGNWAGCPEDSPIRKYLGHNVEQCLDNEHAVRIYRSARVGINLYRREAENDQTIGGWGTSPREVEMAACGAFFMRDPRPEGDQLFHMLPRFGGPAEATEILRWWLRHPEQREKTALQAREAVQGRTFTEHAKSLLRLIEGSGQDR